MKKLLLASATVALFASSNAYAAANLTSATVRGGTMASPSSTVWNTIQDSFYTLFIQQPFANALNGTNPTINDPTTLGGNDFLISGDGFPSGSITNSDLNYTITLGFADGATISGMYNTISGAFTAGSSSTVGDTTYTLTGFGWNRNPNSDIVSQFAPTKGNDTSDYTGLFSFDASAVPEPATWAMMLIGFGMVGGAARYRRRNSQVVYS
ncbi:hypothetical protein GGQ80_000057 [Sphingomonas jinjuensis]|uniref:Ice-binding protein C-terminal domain-containing protein n=1 Tax=Sphingomonas jinjuensis TaxID=535907 RepID=A0A840F6T3_9SPHN|nr:PEPxxWA-CTERM sorting domain-containing protein [Sphingomonas jinjuensis]MBB4152181.1 hypothetical protein [Sphingomonas jinjuensis]